MEKRNHEAPKEPMPTPDSSGKPCRDVACNVYKLAADSGDTRLSEAQNVPFKKTKRPGSKKPPDLLTTNVYFTKNFLSSQFDEACSQD